jgi:hypothetical protein
MNADSKCKDQKSNRRRRGPVKFDMEEDAIQARLRELRIEAEARRRFAAEQAAA